MNKSEYNTSLEDCDTRHQVGRNAGILGLIINLLLFVLKLVAGILSGSIAVIADAVNNLSDAAVSTITFLGFAFSRKPADREHPYGHARMEYITGFLIAVVIVVLGFEFGRSSVEKIISPEEYLLTPFMIGVLIFSILVKVVLFFFYKFRSRQIKSITLEAAAADSRNDVIVTLAILVSIAIKKYSGFNPDGYMGLLISGMILYFGVRLAIDTSSPLLGNSMPEDMMDELESRILSYKGVFGIHDLHIHSYGYGRYFASVHCEVPTSDDLISSHEMADTIERDIQKCMSINLVIHVDPIDIDDERTRSAYHKVKATLREISEDLSFHDFRVVWGSKYTKYFFDVVMPYEFKLDSKELEALINEKLQQDNPRIRTIILFDRR